MVILLVSSNQRKIAELTLLLSPAKIEVMEFEYPELKLDDPCEISKAAAKMLAEKFRKTVMVEDSGCFIDGLNGFPGIMTKFTHNRVGNKGLLKLMKGIKNRKAHYKSAIGICSPGKQPMCFLGTEEGSIAEKIRGKNGWGQDPIFIPKGSSKTYGETGHPDGYHLFRKNAVDKFKANLRK
ncbi:non-canonical purine NTP pyrophosphatase [Candidatus Woesearchaeota archaeon]|nr:non-canonical purine NTP pyrophosphatase [Candidatus Woesearchaeota archaeon]